MIWGCSLNPIVCVLLIKYLTLYIFNVFELHLKFYIHNFWFHLFKNSCSYICTLVRKYQTEPKYVWTTLTDIFEKILLSFLSKKSFNYKPPVLRGIMETPSRAVQPWMIIVCIFVPNNNTLVYFYYI